EQGGPEGRDGRHRGRHASHRRGPSRAVSFHIRQDRTKRRGRVREARENDRVAFVVDGLSLAAIVKRPGSGILIVAGSREFRGSREFCREACRAVVKTYHL